MLRKVTFLIATAAFLAIPSGPAHGNPNLFLPYVAFPTGSWPEAVAIGDVNSDGRNDVVVTTMGYFDPENDYHIHVFLQDSSGGLEPPIKYAAGNGRSVDIGDLNNDGRNDVVTTVEEGIGVFLQNDSGGLNPIVTYRGITEGDKVRIGDLNNDGLLDVVCIYKGSRFHDVDVFLQIAGGTLNAPVRYQVGYYGRNDLEVDDVNDDALDDVVVMSGSVLHNCIGLLLQEPDGEFGDAIYPDIGTIPLCRGIGVGDVDGDSLMDIVLSHGGNRPYSMIDTLLQDKEGTLEPAMSYPSYDIPGPVEVADVNSDGRDDIVVVHDSWMRMGLYLQHSDGTLAPEELYAIPYAMGKKPHGLAVGDINGDTAGDIAIASFNAFSSSGLVVLYHSPPDCLFQHDQRNDTTLSVWGENWTLTGPGGLEASGTGARRHGDRIIVAGRHGDVVVSGTALCPSGPGHFRAVELDPPRRKLRLVDLG